jgi:hypothetical protein
VKMSTRWVAVGLLLTTISIPATLFATTEVNCEDPQPPVVHPSPMPIDGNPWPHMVGQL